MKNQKGRNRDLLEKRNAKICERFTYWYGERKVRLDETLRILSEEEFFLSVRHLWRIISDRKDLLSAEAIERVRKPRVMPIRGVPDRVRVLSEQAYSLFPFGSAQ